MTFGVWLVIALFSNVSPHTARTSAKLPTKAVVHTNGTISLVAPLRTNYELQYGREEALRASKRDHKRQKPKAESRHKTTSLLYTVLYPLQSFKDVVAAHSDLNGPLNDMSFFLPTFRQTITHAEFSPKDDAINYNSSNKPQKVESTIDSDMVQRMQQII
jgi:glyceraldehyde-3-phosphate dehydrogenase/erythrose-4-phosphate dehydrogenase